MRSASFLRLREDDRAKVKREEMKQEATGDSISRRSLLGEVGLVAAGLSIGALARDTAGAAETSAPPRPRLPLRIFAEGRLKDANAARIAAISPQIALLRDRKQWADELPTIDVIFGSISRDDFPKAKMLRWVQTGSAGVESICYPELVSSDVVLTNAKGSYAPAIAEHVFALLLGLTRGVVAHARQNQWGSRKSPVELREMTMGIVGLGGIGRQTARRAKAFDMHVIAVDAEPMYAPPRYAMVDEVGLVQDGLDDLLKRSDVVVCAAPLTSRSKGMFGEQQFAAMKEGAYFINVSRGKLVQTDALLSALKSGHLAGAGMDVTDPEPLPADHPLWQQPNAIITSHIAGQSQYSTQRVNDVFVENVRRYVNDLPMLNIVDKQKGY